MSTTSDQPVGQRFSQTYMSSPELLPDSVRMRRRLGHLYGQYRLTGFGAQLAGELGVPVEINRAEYDFYWPTFLEKAQLRDVLDSITVRYKNLALPFYDATDKELPKVKAEFLVEARRIFAEERVRYRIDDRGGVHFTVDAEFERSRISTLIQLGQSRYAGVRELFEAAFAAMDTVPPDGKSGTLDFPSPLRRTDRSQY